MEDQSEIHIPDFDLSQENMKICILRKFSSIQ